MPKLKKNSRFVLSKVLFAKSASYTIWCEYFPRKKTGEVHEKTEWIKLMELLIHTGGKKKKKNVWTDVRNWKSHEFARPIFLVCSFQLTVRDSNSTFICYAWSLYRFQDCAAQRKIARIAKLKLWVLPAPKRRVSTCIFCFSPQPIHNNNYFNFFIVPSAAMSTSLFCLLSQPFEQFGTSFSISMLLIVLLHLPTMFSSHWEAIVRGLNK